MDVIVLTVIITMLLGAPDGILLGLAVAVIAAVTPLAGRAPRASAGGAEDAIPLGKCHLLARGAGARGLAVGRDRLAHLGVHDQRLARGMARRPIVTAPVCSRALPRRSPASPWRG